MKKLFLAAGILLSALCVTAQQTTERGTVVSDPNAPASRTVWELDRFRDHWFISIQGGVADLMSEESRYVDFGDRIKPTVGLSVGKWITPVWGVRLNVTAAELQGFSTWNYNTDYGLGDWYVGKNYDNPYGINSTNNYIHAYDPQANVRQFVRENYLGDKRESSEGPGYEYNIKYAAGSIDFLLNLKNLFMKYRIDAPFNPIIYGGLGYSHTFQEKNRTAVNTIMERVGLMLDFRLSDAWSVFLDGQAMIVPEAFDRKTGDGMMQDVVGNYTLGFTYKFLERNFKPVTVCDPVEIARLNDEINELRRRPEFCPPPVVCPPPVICPTCPECPKSAAVQVPALVEKGNMKFLPKPVFFRINSSVVEDDQWHSIRIAAEYLAENPDAKMKLTGYADKQTGNPTINKRLSEQRAKSVYKILTTKFGIEPSRLEATYLGDAFQPFSENNWNRVVIFVVQ